MDPCRHDTPSAESLAEKSQSIKFSMLWNLVGDGTMLKEGSVKIYRSMKSFMYSVQCTVYSVQCTLYSIHSTVNVKCTVNVNLMFSLQSSCKPSA